MSDYLSRIFSDTPLMNVHITHSGPSVKFGDMVIVDDKGVNNTDAYGFIYTITSNADPDWSILQSSLIDKYMYNIALSTLSIYDYMELVNNIDFEMLKITNMIDTAYGVLNTNTSYILKLPNGVGKYFTRTKDIVSNIDGDSVISKITKSGNCIILNTTSYPSSTRVMCVESGQRGELRLLADQRTSMLVNKDLTVDINTCINQTISCIDIVTLLGAARLLRTNLPLYKGVSHV